MIFHVFVRVETVEVQNLVQILGQLEIEPKGVGLFRMLPKEEGIKLDVPRW